MQHHQHVEPNFVPDTVFFKQLIAKLILFRTAQKIVRQQKFPAYQANIVTYLVAMIAWQTGGKLDLERIWRSEAISAQLEELIRSWSIEIDAALRNTADGRMISEWAKKEECWLEITRHDLSLPGSPPPEWPK